MSKKIIIAEMCDSSSDEKEKKKEKENEPEIPLPQPKMQYLYPKVHFLERNAGQQLGFGWSSKTGTAQLKENDISVSRRHTSQSSGSRDFPG